MVVVEQEVILIHYHHQLELVIQVLPEIMDQEILDQEQDLVVLVEQLEVDKLVVLVVDLVQDAEVMVQEQLVEEGLEVEVVVVGPLDQDWDKISLA